LLEIIIIKGKIVGMEGKVGKIIGNMIVISGKLISRYKIMGKIFEERNNLIYFLV
jgi:hypothetical protein